MKHTERSAALKHATTLKTRNTAYTAALSCKGPVRGRWAIPQHGGRPVATTLIAGLLAAGAGLPIRASGRQLTGHVRVLDVLRIRADKPARSAVLTLKLPLSPQDISCDVLVAGASTGGVAAALAVAKGEHTVCLTEETKWIGGQMTAQGVSAFDGNRYIETTAPTASFAELARGIRNYYQQHDQLSALGASEKYFNPGNCWVSSLCFQAPAGLKVLNSMLEPYELKGLLRIFLRTKVVKVERQDREITSVLAYAFTTHQWANFKARYVLDATDTGELLPLAGAEYVTGAEPRSLTGEPHARAGHGDPNDDQSFTYTFVLTLDPGHNHRIPKPAGYEAHRLDQPYTLNVNYGHGKTLTYGMFRKAAGTPGSFWAYRRLIAADNFAGPRAPLEQSMVNWPGNDYCDSNLLSNDPLKQAQALREAKLVALGFVYWLQTNAPRDDGRGAGYPGFELLRSASGTEDGLSQFPYVRESRRIRALKTVMEQEISSPYQQGPRAARFEDSVGIGLYPIDIHSCSKQDFTSGTKPFQIPLSALISVNVDNLLAASKNIGMTHITNGAYRLHPIEWAIGEGAGTVADFALDHHRTPRQIEASNTLTGRLQADLLRRGAPIYWFNDLTRHNPAFAAAQFLAVREIFVPNPKGFHFDPNGAVTRAQAVRALANALFSDSGTTPAGQAALQPATPQDTADAERRLVQDGYMQATSAAAMNQNLHWQDLETASQKLRLRSWQRSKRWAPVTRADFVMWLENVYWRRRAHHATTSLAAPRANDRSRAIRPRRER